MTGCSGFPWRRRRSPPDRLGPKRNSPTDCPPIAGHSDPTRLVDVVRSPTIPGESHPNPAVFVDVDLLARVADDFSSLHALDDGLRSHPRRTVGDNLGYVRSVGISRCGDLFVGEVIRRLHGGMLDRSQYKRAVSLIRSIGQDHVKEKRGSKRPADRGALGRPGTGSTPLQCGS